MNAQQNEALAGMGEAVAAGRMTEAEAIAVVEAPAVEASKTVHATVYFRLSPAGQKNAILAAKPAAKEQQIAGEIPATDLDWCDIDSAGNVAADLRRRRSFDSQGNYPGYYDSVEFDFDVPPASAADAIATARGMAAAKSAKLKSAAVQKEREEAERQAQKNAEYAACLAEMQAALDADPNAIPKIKLPSNYSEWQWAGSDVPVAVEIRRRQKLAAQAEARVKAEAEAAAKLAIRAWLAEHGTADQVERFDAGLLAEEEYLKAMADFAFASLDGFGCQPYRKITAAEIREAVHEDDDQDYSDNKAEYRSTAPASLTGAQWQRLKDMRAQLPEGTVEPRLHEGTLDSDDVPWGVVERYGALAKAQVAGIEVRREYAL